MFSALDLSPFVVFSVEVSRREENARSESVIPQLVFWRRGLPVTGDTARPLEGEVAVILYFWENVWLDTY